MKTPLISIIIPVYNVEPYLKRCINSVIAQTYKNLEIILIDDGSTDKSGIMCDEFKKKDKRIITIHQKNQGLSGARNTALDISKGEYISFIDSDDYVDSDFIQILYNLMVSNNADISICSSLFLRVGGNITQGHTYKDELISYKDIHSIPVWERLYKRFIFNDIRFPLGKLCEDSYIFFSILSKAKTIVSTSNALYIHDVQNTHSITNSINQKLCVDLCEGMYTMIVFASKHDVNKNNINNWFLWMRRFYVIYYRKYRYNDKSEYKRLKHYFRKASLSSFNKLSFKNKLVAIFPIRFYR